VNVAGRVIYVRIPTAYGERVTILPFSDLHLDSHLDDRDGFLRFLRRRVAEANGGRVVACAFGDTDNLILPVDRVRHQVGVTVPELAEKRDMVQEVARYCAGVMTSVEGVEWAVVSPGNHEFQVLKRHLVDLIAPLATHVGAQVGGYWGFVRFILGPDRATRAFTVLYHHGAWGGAVIRGEAGLRRWAAPFLSCGPDVVCAGHNHFLKAVPDPKFTMSQRGYLRESRMYWLATGTYQRGFDPKDAGYVSYGELKGHVAVLQRAPTIQVSVEHTKKETWLDSEVTI